MLFLSHGIEIKKKKLRVCSEKIVIRNALKYLERHISVSLAESRGSRQESVGLSDVIACA